LNSEQFSQSLKKFFIGEIQMTRINDCPRFRKEGGRNKRLEGAVSPEPHLRRIVDALMFQFEGAPVVNVGTNVLWVDEPLMD
jgi:hypothetical protein